MRRTMLLLALLAGLMALSASPALAATATTGTANPVGQTTATLNATVNLGGAVAVTSCVFDYGTSASYGQTANCTANPATSGDSPVTANLTGLTAGTTYHFKIVVGYLTLAVPPTQTVSGLDASFTTSATGTAPQATTTAATAVNSTSAQLNGSVVPGSDNLTDCYFSWGTAATALTHTAPCATTPGAGSSAVAVNAVIAGLSASTTYYYALTATSPAGTSTGTTLNFNSGTTAASAPTAAMASPPATSVTDTSATVTGTVNPKGSGVIHCLFEYGQTTSYGQSAPCSPVPASNSSDQTVSAALTGLSTGTTYHVRVDISTGGGFATSPDATFATGGPQVTTVGASAVTASSAILHGSANAEGATVTGCAFFYGPTTAYGHSVACSPSAISGSTTQAEAAALTGLAPKTTYHFLIALTTNAGTAYGADQTFTTLVAPTGATLAATGVGGSTATLHGTVNPQGAAVIACVFQYGVSPFGYGGTRPVGLNVPCSPTPKATAANQSVKVALRGLASKTTYYYRVVLETRGGFLVGSTLHFRTATIRLPGVKITKVKVSLPATIRFYFKATGVKATKYECAVATISRKGKVGKIHYGRCKSPKRYTIKHQGRYEFLVRAGNAGGYGKAATHKFGHF